MNNVVSTRIMQLFADALFLSLRTTHARRLAPVAAVLHVRTELVWVSWSSSQIVFSFAVKCLTNSDLAEAAL